ncbi:MAG: neutral/alkaline non-lysosomal ceramidase N-terminal domain-containing protein [Candidatus Lindowbacteria bacterium]|nr:neutral/alkaline non-lysosomal ceramidase N-terminal domain-containing protein [Candidatus Lindowbacteria bacterium]
MKKKSKPSLLVGFARVDITPAESLPMGGYIARKGVATGAHDPLYAKAVAFRYGETAAILLSLDILCVSAEWARHVRQMISEKLGLPAENILIAATHTHSGPGVFFPIRWRNEQFEKYEMRLAAACIESAEKSFVTAEPARVRIRSLRSTGIGSNRRHPLGDSFVNLSIIRIEGRSGKVKGHLVSFPCHPTVMPAENLQYSADLFGAGAGEVEKRFRGSLCMIFNGTAADISTRFTRWDQTWPEVARLGQHLASYILKGSRDAKPVREGPVSAIASSLRFAFREIIPVERAQKEFDEIRTRIEVSAARQDADVNPFSSKSLLEGASAQLALSQIGSWEPLFATYTANVEIAVIRIGSIIVCGLPGEFFMQRGIDLKRAASPKSVFIVGYANGYSGYFVPPTEIDFGGYEALMSPLEPKAEPEIIGAAKTLIHAVKKPRRREAKNVS